MSWYRRHADAERNRNRQRFPLRRLVWPAVAIPVLGLALACGDNNPFKRGRGANEAPVELPVLLTIDLPFRYPPALFAQRIPGDVTLQLFIDSIGLVVPESIRVAEPANYAEFDSSAVAGAPRLLFRPARRGDRRIPYTVLFPIKFRVPGAADSAQGTSGPPKK